MQFKDLLNRGEPAIVPGCSDPLMARIAEQAGFVAVGVGGYDVGATTTITEPLLTGPDMLEAASRIRQAVNIPIVVDVGAGFGEPMHVVHTVKQMRHAGVQAIHLEDQIYPERAHYFRDYEEHTITREQFLDKLRWAKSAAGDEVAVIARTDTYKTAGADEAVARCRLAFDVGADAVMAFPNTMQEARELPGQVSGPVVYVNTHGNRVGRPSLTQAQVKEYGYALLFEPHVFLFGAFAGARRLAHSYSTNELWSAGDEVEVRQSLEELLRFDELWHIEASTVEQA